MKDWEALGLGFVPNVGENSVHASASPFEGLAERMNWLQADPAAVRISRINKLYLTFLTPN